MGNLYQASNQLTEHLQFASRNEFRNWLSDNCLSSGGIWALFGKAGGPKTIKANEALEEALCFGWIDGQIQSIDDKSYMKYFSARRKNSKWSEKNMALSEVLQSKGMMTVHGEAKIKEAKENGQWGAPKPPGITDAQIKTVSDMLRAHEPAHTNFLVMPPSVKKVYTRGYFDAKTDAGRNKRLSWMIERLSKNLKPM